MVYDTDEACDAKNRIIDYAQSLVTAQGFARVSIEEITSGLGMSKKTFYRHFENKDDLIRQIVFRMTGTVGRRIDAIISSGDPFVVMLNNLTRFFGEQFHQVSTPLLRDLSIHVPDMWQHIQEFRRNKVLTVWAKLIEQGKQEGLVRAEVNSRLVLLAIIGVVEAIVNPKVLSNESFSADEAMEGIINLFFQGVLTPDAVRQLKTLHVSPQ